MMLKTQGKVALQGLPISIQKLSSYFGYSRSGYYKAVSAQDQREEEKDFVLNLAHRERYLQPRLASDKIFRLIAEELKQHNIKLGRDKLYNLFRDNDMLLKPTRRKTTRTTDSRHGYKRYINLLKDKQIHTPNQVWVCDITYLSIGNSWMYLCLIMDAYSRKIVGWCLHDTLEMVGCMQALKMALRSLPAGFDHRQLIHHSDHGVQYCCHAYRNILKKKDIQISMAAKGDCYENAQAERLNGILKQEYGLGEWIATKAQAKVIVRQSVKLYNTRRPHRALALNIPNEVHSGKVVKVRMHWPKKKFKYIPQVHTAQKDHAI